jgi:hypothetical protein
LSLIQPNGIHKGCSHTFTWKGLAAWGTPGVGHLSSLSIHTPAIPSGPIAREYVVEMGIGRGGGVIILFGRGQKCRHASQTAFSSPSWGAIRIAFMHQPPAQLSQCLSELKDRKSMATDGHKESSKGIHCCSSQIFPGRRIAWAHRRRLQHTAGRQQQGTGLGNGSLGILGKKCTTKILSVFPGLVCGIGLNLLLTSSRLVKYPLERTSHLTYAAFVLEFSTI